MSARLAARLARRELRGGLRGFRIFLACLALGVAAIAAVGMVRSAIQSGLERESAAMLGGDAEIELTYRYANDEERAWMRATASTVSEVVDFRGMAVVERNGETERGLTQIRAVDDAYPLVGQVRLEPEMPLDRAFAGADGLPGIVMERALSDRLALAPGDRVRLGMQEFVLMAVLARYPDSAAGGFGLGPRSLVLARDLEARGSWPRARCFLRITGSTCPGAPICNRLRTRPRRGSRAAACAGATRGAALAAPSVSWTGSARFWC